MRGDRRACSASKAGSEISMCCRQRMKHRTRAAILACELALVLAANGCRQIVGFDHGEPASKAGACNLPYATRDCAACVETSCCAESTACAQDVTCARHAKCVGACGEDPQCRAQCALASPPASSSAGPALAVCLTLQCENACGLGCGLTIHDYGDVPPETARDCHECIASKGCESERACAASVDCDAFKRCASACRTQDCKQACLAAHEASGPLLLSGASFLGAPCATSCAVGSDWSCVGHVSWPKPKSDTVTLTVVANDPVAGKTVEGLQVSACSRSDFTCEHPLASGTTDDKGRVVLTCPNKGTTTFFGFDGYVQLISDQIHQLTIWGHPLSEAQAARDTSLFSNVFAVLTPEELRTLGGVPPDSDHGIIVAGALDCQQWNASEVEFTLDPPADVAPVYGFIPSLTATNSGGYASFSHVRPGVVEVIATPKALGRPSSRQSVLVRAGWVTGIVMLPTPLP
jgi:hypothetical protein